MARPQKATVDYFPHDALACTGDTLTVLQSQFGNDGYAFWFKLLEKLASTDRHYLDCRNTNKWQLLLAKTGVNNITGVEIMKLLVEMNAIDSELWQDNIIWCQNLVNNIADVYKNRRRAIPQKPIVNGNNPLTTDHIPITTENVAGNPVTTDESTQSKLKETIYIYSVWNEQQIISHNNMTDIIKRAITTALKDHSKDEIVQAIKNYAEILNGDEYYFKYKWTLKDFLKRGLDKFTDLEVAKSNYRKDPNRQGKKEGTPGYDRRELYEKA